MTIAFAVLIKEHLYKPLFTLFLLLDTQPSIKTVQINKVLFNEDGL